MAGSREGHRGSRKNSAGTMWNKENLLERIYDEPSFIDVFKKRYSEANNTVESARLRLVVCKSHRRRIDKNSFVEKIIEKQARLVLPTTDAILIRRCSSGRIVFWNSGAQKLYGWSKKSAIRKRACDLLQTKLPEPLKRSKPSFGATVAGLESCFKRERTGEKLWWRVTGRCARARTEVRRRFYR
jgi:PAS domain-containing protein